ncbi:hypothetical protein [Amycolatopsis cihanbeyliensis]|uniref:Uncharacterized protein n=1 Tax=Amycolatopsis cihanbeyliensis TaxID=1128664 RepID=A0A542DMG5_AMYCI|nr:hypothetical protein [Amycolatopsis cihanbeyliensis]TQJ04277.1 hypothetical protein FB471_4063 [Amycolatopsis cihanbeyliensis]
MSSRTRGARRLATLLTTATGVHVLLRYQRDANRYCVAWTGGPTVDAMQALTAKHRAEVPALNSTPFTWSRAEP